MDLRFRRALSFRRRRRPARGLHWNQQLDEVAQGLTDATCGQVEMAWVRRGRAFMLNARLMPSGLISLALLIGGPTVALAHGPCVFPGKCGWEAFSGSSALGSFAWAGEDEGFFGSGPFASTWSGVELDGSAADPALLTGIPAPEPPALVLAGLAFGGVLCGRSLVMRRRQVSGESVSESDTPRA